jgi:uncharacterized phage protein gp47/JayE
MAYAPPSIGPSGLSVPSYQDILADNIQQFLKIYGQNEYVGIDSAAYQFISIISLKQSDTMAALQLAYNQSSPATAVGAGLDRIVKLNGLARLPYTYSEAVLAVTGTPGTVISNGAAQDTNGNTWLLTTPVTIPSGGVINVLATCTTPGNITAEPGAISIIATPQFGWASVTNASAAIPGTGVETDSQLRARQAISVALPSKTMLDGTYADIAEIPGVTRLNVLENFTGGVDDFGNPPHSVTCVVEGGTLQAIAQAIYNNRGIGPYTNGKVNGSAISQTQTVVINDPFTGYPLPISFISPPAYVPVFVTLNVHLLAGGTSATIAAIQAAVVAYLNSLEIGETIVFSELYGAALNARSNPDAPTFSIRSIFSGLSTGPTGTVDLPVEFFQVSQGASGNIVVNSI